MHHIVCQLFWLHVEADCTLKLRWVPSKDNAVANALTRPETSQHFRLGGRGYGSYGHDCVLTAAPYFRRGARRAPTILFKTPHRRKLWHRCFSAGRWAYAVLYGPMFRLLPPPPPTDGWGRHRTFMRVPCAFRRRNPSSLSLSVSIGNFARPKETNVFFRVHHLKGETLFILYRWGMRTVEVDFRDDT